MDTNFLKWLLFSFSGRITRKYYWYVLLAFFIVEMLFFGVFFGASMGDLASGNAPAMSPIAFICGLPLLILAVWIGLAIQIKRWHDRAKSGWWVLIAFVPLIGGLWALIECGFLAGTAGVNQYGTANVPPANPLSTAAK